MIYFLINNEYELCDALIHSKELGKENVFFIIIKHRDINLDMLGDAYLLFESPFVSRFGYVDLLSIWRIVKNIRQLNKGNSDTLIAYSLYDPINVLILLQFKSKLSQIYLFITAPMLYSDTSNCLNFWQSIKNIIRTIYIKTLALNFSVKSICRQSILMYSVDREYINGKISYFKFDSVKGVRNYHVNANVEVRSRIDNCIFLSQPIYKQLYCSSEEYVSVVMEILIVIHNNFDIVYFKQHPGDNLSVINLIKNNVKENNINNIIFLKERTSVEMLPGKYDFSHSISFFSTSLLNLKQYYGVEPIYVYHLIPFLRGSKALKETSIVLSRNEYKFIDSFESISPEYKSNLCASDNTLGGVVKF
mgnify:FL=1